MVAYELKAARNSAYVAAGFCSETPAQMSGYANFESFPVAEYPHKIS
jgi:hypothetical protein